MIDMIKYALAMAAYTPIAMLVCHAIGRADQRDYAIEDHR